jgi:hypothetical protein
LDLKNSLLETLNRIEIFKKNEEVINESLVNQNERIFKVGEALGIGNDDNFDMI